MVQVHVPPRDEKSSLVTGGISFYVRATGALTRHGTTLLQLILIPRKQAGSHRAGGRLAHMKKLLILVVVALGGFAVWRKVQAQRADLDLWSEATAPDDY